MTVPERADGKDGRSFIKELEERMILKEVLKLKKKIRNINYKKAKNNSLHSYLAVLIYYFFHEQKHHDMFLSHQQLLYTIIFKYMNNIASYKYNLFNKFPIVDI